MNTYSRIAFSARKDVPQKQEVLDRITHLVVQAGAQVCAQSEKPDLIIVIGGDGTIISTVREMEDLSIPILGIHYGSLGFLTSIESADLESHLLPLLQGEGVLDERQLLSICIEENGAKNSVGRVLNEAVISQGGISRMLKLHTTINGEELTTFRSDGLILATPTGSTAYSLAAGGTVVHPSVQEHTVLLTPINPHSFYQKPLIVPGDSDIAVEILTTDNAYRSIHPVLTLDGQITHPLQRGQKVHTCSYSQRVRFVRHKEDSFYKRIREKLNWGE